MKFRVMMIRRLGATLGCIGMLWTSACASYLDIPPRMKGGVLNPIRCDGAAGEIEYLRRLRGPDGRPPQYEFLDSVIGFDERMLDRFRIYPAPPAGRGAEQKPESEPNAGPRASQLDMRVYFDIYHSGFRDEEPVPGYRLEKP